MSTADEAGERPVCWRCGASLRPGVRFCGHCGMALSAADFLGAKSPVREGGPGLGAALATYFVVLAALASLLLVGVTSVRTSLAFDVALLAFATVLVVAMWGRIGPLLAAPSGLRFAARGTADAASPGPKPDVVTR
ncbi:MAG: zinc ribbon domain-containing protein [Caldilineaceae bacterium]|nr:zinc ribbon domain-containing protein [Caldilineaceae bacterium]